MEERIARLEGLVEGIRNEVNHLRNDFRMLLWIQIGSWVSLMAAIIVTRF